MYAARALLLRSRLLDRLDGGEHVDVEPLGVVEAVLLQRPVDWRLACSHSPKDCENMDPKAMAILQLATARVGITAPSDVQQMWGI